MVLIFAHPYRDRSRANARLLDSVRDLPGLEVHSLYDDYPDFDIDVDRERSALARAEIVIWQHPLYWYSVPSLLKHWFDQVLVRGYAYGDGGTALRGKRCLWVTTTGGDDADYTEGGIHRQEFDRFVPAVRQTACFCGMRWETPLVVHGAHSLAEERLTAVAALYRTRLLELSTPREGQP
jgi:glutathione-regulated potassium-efflux system ancillary protein KefF